MFEEILNDDAGCRGKVTIQLSEIITESPFEAE
jgi:hypothetical protein